MSGIAVFPFNPWQENTYLIYDANGIAAVIDPGCYSREEQQELRSFMEAQSLQPLHLLNTHCHIDHVLGNAFVADTWQLDLAMHQGEIPVLKAVDTYADSMGIQYQRSPDATLLLNEGDVLEVGSIRLEVLFTPGHSPASICFYNRAEGYVIGGDVLFLDSIGRTDLPGGDMDTLLNSIRNKIFPLPDDTIVYPGHGPSTTVGREKKHNPFLNGRYQP